MARSPVISKRNSREKSGHQLLVCTLFNANVSGNAWLVTILINVTNLQIIAHKRLKKKNNGP